MFGNELQYGLIAGLVLAAIGFTLYAITKTSDDLWMLMGLAGAGGGGICLVLFLAQLRL
jgi:hypothetical protein